MQGYTYFIVLLQNIGCGYSLEPPLKIIDFWPEKIAVYHMGMTSRPVERQERASEDRESTRRLADQMQRSEVSKCRLTPHTVPRMHTARL